MNPATRGLPPVVLYDTEYLNNGLSAMCVACHTRNPSVHTLDNTGMGAHFVYGGPGVETDNTSAEKLSLWDNAAGLSKYGNISTGTSVTGQNGEIICESCHNLVTNVGKAKLLGFDNESVDPSPLCAGCHGTTGTGHHPLTGEILSTTGLALSNADSASVMRTPVAGSEVTYPGDDAVNCRSCHKAHDAQTKTGARILKRGYKYESVAGDPVDGTGTTGMERRVDMGGGGLVTDFTPLCDACHKTSH